MDIGCIKKCSLYVQLYLSSVLLIVRATVPSSDEALPPSTSAASKDVPRTVKILMASLHLTVLRAFPVYFRYQCI